MTNKDKLNRIKEIEAEQVLLMHSLKVLDNSIRTLSSESNEYLIAREIYDEHSIEIKALISEKIPLLLSLGFSPANGMVDESIRDTDLWKQIETDQINSDIAESRVSVCTNCPEFVTISKQCKPLGVFVEEYSLIESSSCPIGKW